MTQSCIILPTLSVIQLLRQVTKEEKACTPLLNPANIFMYVVCHNGLDRSLPSLKELTELVAIFCVFHVEFMFTIGRDIDF
jgi:hypothetical protein